MACHQTVQVSRSSRARSVAETLTIEDIRKKLLQLQEEEDEVTRLDFRRTKSTLHGHPTNKGQMNERHKMVVR
jgi:hypothetical protein